MKLWNKHRHQPERRLRKCLDYESNRAILIHPQFGDYTDRVREIVLSAERYMTKAEVYAVLQEYINSSNLEQ